MKSYPTSFSIQTCLGTREIFLGKSLELWGTQAHTLFGDYKVWERKVGVQQSSLTNMEFQEQKTYCIVKGVLSQDCHLRYQHYLYLTLLGSLYLTSTNEGQK